MIYHKHGLYTYRTNVIRELFGMFENNGFLLVIMCLLNYEAILKEKPIDEKEYGELLVPKKVKGA